MITAPLTEDFCGVEPVTHPPIEIETRPPPEVDEDRLRDAYGPDTAILGGKFIFLITAIRADRNVQSSSRCPGSAILASYNHGYPDQSVHEPPQGRISNARGQRSRCGPGSGRCGRAVDYWPSSDQTKRMVYLMIY